MNSLVNLGHLVIWQASPVRGQRPDNRSRKGTEDQEEGDYFAKLDYDGLGSTVCFAQAETLPIEVTQLQESLAEKALL